MTLRASFTYGAVAAGLALLSVSPAFAQDPPAPAEPAPVAVAPAPPPAVYRPTSYATALPGGGYVAPIYQQTQGAYVPQSVAMSGPRSIGDYQEGAPVPAGYHVTHRPRTGLIVAGAAVFGGMYFFSLMAASGGADSNRGQSNPQAALFVPGVGPFIQMSHESSATGNVLLAIDGLAQTAGLVMAIYGIASPKTVLVRNDLGKVKIQAAPMVGKGVTGFALRGTF